MYTHAQVTPNLYFVRFSGFDLTCKWLGGDGLPSLVPITTTYGYIGRTYMLTCPQKRFPALSNGVCPKVW